MEKIENATIKDWLTYKSDLKFEVIYNNTVKINISGRNTSFKVGGYGYDKESSVIADFINELIGDLPYKESVYGNTGRLNKDKKTRSKKRRYLSSGTGFSSIQESFNSIRGYKLEKLYSGLNSDVYSIKIPQSKKDKIKKDLKSYYEKRGY